MHKKLNISKLNPIEIFGGYGRLPLNEHRFVHSQNTYNFFWTFRKVIRINYNKFLSYTNAKKYIKKIKIKTFREFRKWAKSNKRPRNIPSNPDKVYKKNWKGWKKFLN